MTKPIESAQEFAVGLCGHIVTSLTNRQRPADAEAEALRLIEARDKAIRLALLDELMMCAVEHSDSDSSYSTYTRSGLEKAYHEMCAKYGDKP